MPTTPKELIKLLKKNGFVYVKTNGGSHQKYFNPESGRTVPVPLHPRELTKVMEKKLLAQAGLCEKGK